MVDQAFEGRAAKTREVTERFGTVLVSEYKGLDLGIAAQASIELAVRLVLMSQMQGNKPQDVPGAIQVVISTLESMRNAALASPPPSGVPSQ